MRRSRDILVTDVTDMHADTVCVAGWCRGEGRMVRPLPDGGNWTALLLSQHGIKPGVVLRVVPTGAASGGTHPHASEDLPVERQSMARIPGPAPAWSGATAPPTHATVQAAFEGHVKWSSEWKRTRRSAYVQDGATAPSLAGLTLPRRQLTLSETVFDGTPKLRARLNDGQAAYDLPVVASSMRAAWRVGGLDAAKALIPRRTLLHVRLGLARAFSYQPQRCIMMLNGILG